MARRISCALLQKWMTVQGTGVRNVTLLVNCHAYCDDTLHLAINGLGEAKRSAVNGSRLDNLYA